MRGAGATRALTVAAVALALGAWDAAGETLAVDFAGAFERLSGAAVSIPFTAAASAPDYPSRTASACA